MDKYLELKPIGTIFDNSKTSENAEKITDGIAAQHTRQWTGLDWTGSYLDLASPPRTPVYMPVL